MKIDIKHRWTNSVLCSFEATNIKDAVQQAVKSSADLRDANLSSADLVGADLSSADLVGADLRSANLRSADLRDADLRSADLSSANLRSANLSSANLSGTDLSNANLSSANLRAFKSDFFDVLLRAPKEIAGLRRHLINGEVDGSCYEGECACLLGTIANVRYCSYQEIGNGISPDNSRPAEQWFMSIKKGDTPENNNVSKITIEWLDEFVNLLEAAK